MRSNLVFIIFLCLFSECGLFAQIIKADRTLICDSAFVQFSLDPPVSTGTAVSWNFGNGKTASGDFNPSVLYNVPGKYSVSCILNNTITINAPDLIRVYRTPSSKFEYKDSLEISDYSYVFRYIQSPSDTGTLILSWIFSDGGTGSVSPILHTFSGTGTYVVRLVVNSASGCAGITERNIAVSDLLKAPNVFTPNNDAINDFFEIRTNGNDIYIFSVYTRSGVLVFRSESPRIFWDGRNLSGVELTEGIYYYTIEQKTTGSADKMNGIVYLYK